MDYNNLNVKPKPLKKKIILCNKKSRQYSSYLEKISNQNQEHA